MTNPAAAPLDSLHQELIEIFSKEAAIDRSALAPDATLDDLGVQSLDVVMVLMEVEQRYDVYIPVDHELSGALTLAELLDLLVARIKAGPDAGPPAPEPVADAQS